MKNFWLSLLVVFSTVTGLLAAHSSCNSCNNLTFKENKGQWHANVLFTAELKNGAAFFEKSSITFNLFDTRDIMRIKGDHHKHERYTHDIDYTLHFHAVRMNFEGSLANKTQGFEPVKEYFNYFLGNDKSKWASKVKAYTKISYSQLYPGIMLHVSSHEGKLKYAYEVAPGADVSRIKVAVEGADKVLLNEKNELVIKTTVGDIIDLKPYAYQVINGTETQVPCHFVLNDNNTVSYLLPNGYDKSKPLVIDPTMEFSTYSGSRSDNFGYSATYDSKGNAFAAGSVFGPLYPITTGAYQTTYIGGLPLPNGGIPGDDIGITKYNSDGTQRIYSTYLGGFGQELPHSLIANASDELYILGTTDAADYPTTTGAYDTTFGGGPDPGMFTGIAAYYRNGSDIVISRLSADGSQLLSSTFVGGSANDGLNYTAGQPYNAPGLLRHNYADEVRGEIDIDKFNNVYVASCTRSVDFPRVGTTFQNSFGGNSDACIFKMDASLSTMLWSTTFGGAEDDAAYSVAIDSAQNLFIAGGTASANFPVSAGAISGTLAAPGEADGFVVHIDKTGQNLIASTYYGYEQYDQIYFVEVDRRNNVYVFGQADSSGTRFIKNAGYNRPGGGQFISKFTNELDSVIWSTSFGRGRGVADISPTAFLVDVCNSVYACGWGSQAVNDNINGTGGTLGMFTTPGAYKGASNDSSDFYLMVLKDDASAVTYATFIGGNISEEHVDGGTSRFDRKGIVYQSVCAGCGSNDDFPTTPGAVSRVNMSTNCNNAVFKFNLDIPACVADFDAPNACRNLPVNFTNKSVTPTTGLPSFQWLFGDGGTATSIDATHTYAQAGIYTVTLIVTDANSCNGSDTLTKTIAVIGGNAPQTLPALGVCQSQGVQIGIPPTNDSAITYVWTPAGGLSSTNISNPYASPTQNTTYRLIVSNGVCLDTFYQNVYITRDTFNATASNVVCVGDTVLLDVTGSTTSIYSYAWTPANLIVAGANTANPLAVPTGDVTFYVTIETQGHCFYTDSVRVNFPDSSVLVNADFVLPPSGCVPDTLSFVNTSFGTNAITYQWVFDDGGTSTQTNPTHIYRQGGIFDVMLIATDNGSCNKRDTIVKSLLILADTNYFLSATTICLGDSVQIGINTSNPSLVYQWQPPVYLSNPNTPNPIASPPVTTTYSLFVSNGICADSVTQIVNVIDDSIYTSNDTTVCAGSSAQLFAAHAGPSDTMIYTWLPAANIIAGGNTASPVVQVSANTVFTVSAVNEFGCVYYDTVEVLVSPSTVSVSAGADPDTIKYGETSQLQADTANALWFGWLPNPTLSDTIIVNPVASPSQTTTYYALASDENGCYKTDSVTVYLLRTPCEESNLFIPNGFSPNGDGKNDVLYVRGNDINKFYFAVYDRWGQRVFETRDITKGWDGNFKGRKLDPAVFGYYTEGECIGGTKFLRQGNVTLFR